ncbi:type II toxin-antitoxin system RelE/ParE family toxin [archaeon]|nr:type II toxin-antitoxin system RelE/ParE family toxin [archaeon]
MSYTVRSLGVFKKQIEKLDKNSRKLIQEKIRLLKENPYRYKKIHSKIHSRVFRIRFNLQGKEMRLIYVVIEPNVVLVCLLNRKKDYKGLENHLKRLKPK